MSERYQSGSLSLSSTVAMGTGVMIGADIFALTGQRTGGSDLRDHAHS